MPNLQGASPVSRGNGVGCSYVARAVESMTGSPREALLRKRRTSVRATIQRGSVARSSMNRPRRPNPCGVGTGWAREWTARADSSLSWTQSQALARIVGATVKLDATGPRRQLGRGKENDRKQKIVLGWFLSGAEGTTVGWGAVNSGAGVAGGNHEARSEASHSGR